MRPLTVLIGIVMGSTVSIAAALLLTLVVFVLLPEYSARLAPERGPLMVSCVVMVVLALVSVASFYGELRARAWRWASHAGLLAAMAVVVWVYWPR
jgi:hypothetical protein